MDPNKDKDQQPDKGSVLEVDGEKVTAEDIRAMKTTIKQNGDWKAANTQEAQRLAEERKRLAEYVKLDNLLQSDPNKARKVYEIISGKDATNLDDLTPEQAIQRIQTETNNRISALQNKISTLEESKNIDAEVALLEKKIDEALVKFKYADRFEIMRAVGDGSKESIMDLAEKSDKRMRKFVSDHAKDIPEAEEDVVRNYLDKKKKKATEILHGGTPPGKTEEKELKFSDGSLEQSIKKTLDSMQSAD